MELPQIVLYHDARRVMLEVVPEDLTPGLVAGERFRLERKLGAGGMGEVWAATHLVTGKAVALKFLDPSRAADARSRARVAVEARATSAVRHPNVVQVHDVGELESGLPFLVMDLLEGETLADRLQRDRRLSIEEATRTLGAVVDAVRAAHAASVVHRDLKPANVFLERRDDGATQVRVLDFGIAKLVDAARAPTGAPLTSTGEVLGSSLYMAPEQVFGESDVDGRADVWALGVILYEVLTGVRPTERATSGQVLKAITAEDMVPITRLRPDVPPALARLVMRMLARDRAVRPDLAEVAATLARPHATSTRRVRVAAGAVLVGVALGGSVIGATRSRPAPAAAPPATLAGATSAPEAPVAVPSPTPSVQVRATTTPSATSAPTRTAPAPAPLGPTRSTIEATPAPPASTPARAPDVVLTLDRK